MRRLATKRIECRGRPVRDGEDQVNGAQTRAVHSGFRSVTWISAVEALLGLLEALVDQRLDRVGGSVDLQRQHLALRGRVIGEHEVRDVLPTGRSADADAYAVEIAGAQRC